MPLTLWNCKLIAGKKTLRIPAFSSYLMICCCCSIRSRAFSSSSLFCAWRASCSRFLFSFSSTKSSSFYSARLIGLGSIEQLNTFMQWSFVSPARSSKIYSLFSLPFEKRSTVSKVPNGSSISPMLS